MNRLALQAQLLGRGSLRYTPAGLPAIDMSLRHESKLTEAGYPRKVLLELRAVAMGDITLPLCELEIGSQMCFVGFLCAGRSGRGVVFHVTELQ